jgi:hypothetical protein
VETDVLGDYPSELSTTIPELKIPKKNDKIRVVSDFSKNSAQLTVET